MRRWVTICRYNVLIYYQPSRPTQPPILWLLLLAEPDRFHSSACALFINKSTVQCQYLSVKILTEMTTLIWLFSGLIYTGRLPAGTTTTHTKTTTVLIVIGCFLWAQVVLVFFTCKMPFLSANQQCQRTEGNSKHRSQQWPDLIISSSTTEVIMEGCLIFLSQLSVADSQ